MEIIDAEPYESNRIIRRYHDHINNFLRVHFLDNNGMKLMLEFRASIEKLTGDRFVLCLKNEIIFGGRQFNFLVYLNSSLKVQRQVYYFSASEGLNAGVVRNDIGDWDHENSKKLLQSPRK